MGSCGKKSRDPLAIKGTLRKYLLSIKHYIYIYYSGKSQLAVNDTSNFCYTQAFSQLRRLL